jgi:ribosomal protein S18 acetylase RimI-like enzyme
MGQFEMRPFTAPEAETVAHWAESADDIRHVAETEDEKVTPGLVNAWALETNFAFTLRRDGDLVAYGEIVEDEVENDVEVQHLLVAPDMRRRGIGKAMLSRLVAFIAASRPYPEVWMRVGRDNEPALHCAYAVGFIDDEAMAGPRFHWLKKTLRP